MKSEINGFWGLILSCNHVYEYYSPQPFVITMAALDLLSGTSSVTVYTIVDSKKYVLFSLTKAKPQQKINLKFYDKVTIFCACGTSTFYLTEKMSGPLIVGIKRHPESAFLPVSKRVLLNSNHLGKSIPYKTDGSVDTNWESRLNSGESSIEGSNSSGFSYCESFDSDDDYLELGSSTSSNKLRNTRVPNSLSIPMDIDGGLVIQDLVEGNGPKVEKNVLVGVYYVGKVVGHFRSFDSRMSGRPFLFRVGNGTIISGVDRGIIGMRAGGRRRIIIPPHLGFGAANEIPAIPPHSTLQFDIDLKLVSRS